MSSNFEHGLLYDLTLVTVRGLNDITEIALDLKTV